MTAIFAARHDRTILQMLAEGRIVVEEDPPQTLFDESGCAQVTNSIWVRDQRSGRLVRAAISFTGFGGAPRFRVRVTDLEDDGKSRIIWLSVRRTVWLSYHPRPSMYMIVPIDADQGNYNIWNLCERDQGDQKYHQVLRHGRPEAKEADPLDANDVPF